MTSTAIRRGYTDTAAGQIHWRMVEPQGDITQPDLYCLHPAPFSGLAWTTIMPHLAQGRRVIAPDLPGHGGSDPCRGTPSIAGFAAAMMAVADDLSPKDRIDVTGFHSGCLVALEMAIKSDARVRGAVLTDVPYFDADAQPAMLARTGGDLDITPELDCLAGPWTLGMTRRLDSQPVERCFEMFVEQLRHGRAMNAGFHAAFTYPCADRFAMITRPISLIATQSGLLAATQAAAKATPFARLIERPDIMRAVLDEAAEMTAAQILDALKSDQAAR